MSWSVVVQDIPSFERFDSTVIEKLVSSHIMYPFDADTALVAAKQAGLKSATLSGSRTPNPYGRDEVCTISIVGFVEATDFITTMQRIVVKPDE